ncbi:MAG: hypothetical protein A2148_10645 [Chloroflexi bacterium RBG_16_68_14]|nr:MAG: hypothetical protein A2148_10645 [Chloroflexi bacterium RBG_16_68_14]
MAVFLIVAGSLVVAACGSKASDAKTGQPTETDGYRGMVIMTPWEKPAFTLTDTSGTPFDFLKETEGYVALLFFGYTYCPDICPGHMALLAAALKELPEDVSSRVKVVFVTADPDRDTPERLRQWLDNFDPTFIGLIPEGQRAADDISRRALKSLWAPIMNEDLGGGNYAVSHPAVIIAYATDNLAHVLYPFGVKKDAWVHDLPNLVKEGGKEQ